jgi:hypothetical protein
VRLNDRDHQRFRGAAGRVRHFQGHISSFGIGVPPIAAPLDRCQETLPQLQAVGDSYTLARLLNVLTLSRLRRGESVAALEAVDQACALHAQIGDTQGLSSAENQRATVLITLGRSPRRAPGRGRRRGRSRGCCGRQARCTRQHNRRADTVRGGSDTEGTGGVAPRAGGLTKASPNASLQGSKTGDLTLPDRFGTLTLARTGYV